MRNFGLEKILKREPWLLRQKNNLLLNLYILIPSRGQMAQHPILLGAVQIYKISGTPFSAQEMGMANSQLLNVYVISSSCNIFCLCLFFTKYLDHLSANTGCTVLPVCQQMCHVHKSQVQKAEHVCLLQRLQQLHPLKHYTDKKYSQHEEWVLIITMVSWD